MYRLKGNPKLSREWSLACGDRILVQNLEDRVAVEFFMVVSQSISTAMGASCESVHCVEFLMGMSVQSPDLIGMGFDLDRDVVGLYSDNMFLGELGRLPPGMGAVLRAYWGDWEVEKFEVVISSVLREIDLNQFMGVADCFESMSEAVFQGLMRNLDAGLGREIYVVKIGLKALKLQSKGESIFCKPC